MSSFQKSWVCFLAKTTSYISRYLLWSRSRLSHYLYSHVVSLKTFKPLMSFYIPTLIIEYYSRWKIPIKLTILVRFLFSTISSKILTNLLSTSSLLIFLQRWNRTWKLKIVFLVPKLFLNPNCDGGICSSQSLYHFLVYYFQEYFEQVPYQAHCSVIFIFFTFTFFDSGMSSPLILILLNIVIYWKGWTFIFFV